MRKLSNISNPRATCLEKSQSLNSDKSAIIKMSHVVKFIKKLNKLIPYNLNQCNKIRRNANESFITYNEKWVDYNNPLQPGRWVEGGKYSRIVCKIFI